MAVSPGAQRQHAYISKPVVDGTKPAPWMRPNQYKKFDGLNAVNAIMTAVKFGAGNGEKQYFNSLWAVLLGQVGRWPDVMWEGIDNVNVERLLGYAIMWYNETDRRDGNLPNLKSEKIYGIPDTSMAAALSYLDGVLERHVSFALVRTDVPWPHWFVLQYVSVLSNKVRFYALDDYGLVSGVKESTGFKANMADIDVKAVRPDRLFDTTSVYRITRIPR